ncbi:MULTISPECIES: efflux RND transporter periplasmic adaptor subunit [Sulfitobacter]|uniref:Multidrug resistance protein MdtA n=1 Tax=Sulfitobacter dubius TaxID=218673 RepID=A0ABY3ZNT6_9RHOB|nr:efflux RND transporter periplasmic adaptor subunit [Sulfitobacter dubius]UOA15780.1 Multidrug resistance protein MdtA [Sulfitobacter dubius]WOI28830.1 efflux RND transporter periplasmic adaptor subunit [Sulfitobacter dubius]
MKRIAELLLGLMAVAAVTYWLFGERLMPSQGAVAAEESGAGAAPGGGRPGGGRPGGNRAATVTMQSVELSPYVLEYQAVGTIESTARVAVVAEASGQVEELLVAPGDRVTADAPLLRLEQRTQKLDLNSAKASLAEAENALERVERLSATGSVAVTSVQVQEAQTATDLAQVAVDRAELALDRRIIRSPIDGVVGLIDARLGDYLNANAQITTVSVPEQLKVGFSLPERAVAVLEPGLSVDVLLPARIGQVFKAQITAIDTEIDPVTRLIDVEAQLQGDVTGLRHGMIANVVLVEEQEAMPAIPALSIAWSREGASVFVAEQGTVRRVPVTIRHRLDDRVWVDGTLAEGDQIVVEGVQKLREGGQVQTLQLAQAETKKRRAPRPNAQEPSVNE